MSLPPAVLVPAPHAGYAAWRSAAAGAVPGVQRRAVDAALLATYSTDLLEELLPLAASAHGLRLGLRPAGFAQLEQSLLDGAGSLAADPPQYVVLAGTYHDLAASSVPQAVERWTALWAAAARLGIRVVQLGFVPPVVDGYGAAAWVQPGSLSWTVQQVNAELAARAEGAALIVDVARLAATVGLRRWEDPRYWFAVRQPCALDALPELAALIAGALAAELGLARRCVVVDLDGTLWGGVLADDGPEGIQLGDGPAGEAFRAFQAYLLQLRASGVVLAVASKNDEDLVRRVLASHPRMLLRPEHFAAIVADWRPKSVQLAEISERLRLHPATLVFCDDNPAECSQVEAALPAIEVVALHGPASGFPALVAATPGLVGAATVSDDVGRAASYAGLAEAEKAAAAAESLDEFLSGLRMVAEVEPLGSPALSRVAQLEARTNQFNLTGRRRTQAELALIAEHADWRGWTLRLRDRFADHGLVGFLLARADGAEIVVDTLVLSCRVIGRTAERTLVAAAARWARERGAARLIGLYRPSERNGVAAGVYRGLGFAPAGAEGAQRRFVCDLAEAVPVGSPFIREAVDDH